MAKIHEETRKLTRVGQGSLCVVIPAHLIRELGWRERQRIGIHRHGRKICLHAMADK